MQNGITNRLCPTLQILRNPVKNHALDLQTNQAGLLQIFSTESCKILEVQLAQGVQRIQLPPVPAGLPQLKSGNEIKKIILE